MVERKDKMKVLETTDLSMNYGTKKALSDVNVSVEAGEIYGLVGKKRSGEDNINENYFGSSSGTQRWAKTF